MGLGLSVRGTFVGDSAERARQVAAVVRTWAGGELVEMHLDDDETELTFTLHPAAEPIEIAFGPGRCSVSAQTSTVGPGYHAWVCEMLDAAGAPLGIQWLPPDEEEGTGDETGYFVDRDVEALEDEMLRWLRALAETLDDAGGQYAVSLPLDHQYEHDGFIATPVGTRDREWLRRVRQDPRSGIDIFPWWEQGRGAGYEIGRALCRMWTEVRFRPPTYEAEEDVIDDVLERLSRAYAIEPDRAYPFAAWSELLRYAGGPADLVRIVEGRAQNDRSAPIGYRRRPVRVSLGGWSIRIPGELSEEIDDEGAFSAWHEGRTVWLTRYRVQDDRMAFSNVVYEGTPIELPAATGAPRSRATERPYEEAGEQMHLLSVELVAPGRLASCTIVVPTRAVLPWALEIAASIRAH